MNFCFYFSFFEYKFYFLVDRRIFFIFCYFSFQLYGQSISVTINWLVVWKNLRKTVRVFII